MIIPKETAKYSIKKLRQSKSRSLLTLLSIFVGITTIFVFISFGLGLYSYVNEFTTDSSADKITIIPRGTGAPGLDDSFALTNDDLEVIKKTSGVYEVSGIYSKPAEIKQGKSNKFVFVMGYDPKINMVFEMSNIGLESGRWLEKGDYNKALLGYNYKIKDRIFPKPYNLNDQIEIQDKKFRVIGFVESIGSPQDDSQIYLTDKAIEELYNDSLIGYSMVIARVDTADIGRVISDVKKSLRKSRNLEEGKEDFFVQSWQELLETYSAVLNGIVGFVILIALISVIVSAINTANTMITSVLERTKEIGIMKAVGAKNSEIFKIFLFESSILGFIAGVIGVFFGWIITSSASIVLENIGWGFLSPYNSFGLFFGLILFATFTGAISGVLPAMRASGINTVQALRYE